MTLKEYAKEINKLAEKYPNVLVVYSSDDEGNSFHRVNHAGTVGFFDNGDFFDLGYVEDIFGKKPNAVWIN